MSQIKGGAENRKKTIMAGVLGAVALCCVLYGYNALYGGSGPAPTIPVVTVPEKSSTTTSGAGSGVAGGGLVKNGTGLGVAPGVAAVKMASTSSSLDPTLDESAMLRTESLVYSGTGRNIFSATYVPVAAAVSLPKTASPRPGPVGPPPSPPPPPTCPPTCPAINLKFFGTAKRANGQNQAFLLQGEDVYLAAVGDIVARKYKIVSIAAGSIQVEDLVNNNTQTLPLQMN
jgi:hypothetical protein